MDSARSFVGSIVSAIRGDTSDKDGSDDEQREPVSAVGRLRRSRKSAAPSTRLEDSELLTSNAQENPALSSYGVTMRKSAKRSNGTEEDGYEHGRNSIDGIDLDDRKPRGNDDEEDEDDNDEYNGNPIQYLIGGSDDDDDESGKDDEAAKRRLYSFKKLYSGQGKSEDSSANNSDDSDYDQSDYTKNDGYVTIDNESKKRSDVIKGVLRGSNDRISHDNMERLNKCFSAMLREDPSCWYDTKFMEDTFTSKEMLQYVKISVSTTGRLRYDSDVDCYYSSISACSKSHKTFAPNSKTDRVIISKICIQSVTSNSTAAIDISLDPMKHKWRTYRVMYEDNEYVRQRMISSIAANPETNEGVIITVGSEPKKSRVTYNFEPRDDCFFEESRLWSMYVASYQGLDLKNDIKPINKQVDSEGKQMSLVKNSLLVTSLLLKGPSKDRRVEKIANSAFVMHDATYVKIPTNDLDILINLLDTHNNSPIDLGNLGIYIRNFDGTPLDPNIDISFDILIDYFNCS
jgi:hypothetical protein